MTNVMKSCSQLVFFFFSCCFVCSTFLYSQYLKKGTIMTSGVEKKSNFISISLLCYNVIIQWCEIMCVCHMWIFADKSWHGCEKSLTHFAKFHYVWHQIRRCGSFIILARAYTWDVLNKAQKSELLNPLHMKMFGIR